MITRDEIMRRATMAPWEPETVEYDMGVSPEFPTGADCSAYVTWCWNARGDFNTETLVSSGLMYEIPFDSALQGDAMGHCGPGTSGANGHIQLFDKWLNDDPNDSHYYCWQQNGVGLGPHYDLVDMESNYKAYRFTGVNESTESTVSTEGTEMAYTKRDNASGSVWLCDGFRRKGVPNPTAWAALQDAGIPHRGDLKPGEDINWHGSLTDATPAGSMTAKDLADELARRLQS